MVIPNSGIESEYTGNLFGSPNVKTLQVERKMLIHHDSLKIAIADYFIKKNETNQIK